MMKKTGVIILMVVVSLLLSSCVSMRNSIGKKYDKNTDRTDYASSEYIEVSSVKASQSKGHMSSDIDKSSTKSSNVREVIIRSAKNMLGKKYRYGAQDKFVGFDCSGLTQYAYSEAGVKIPRTANSQYRRSQRLEKKALKKGDLVFFSTKGTGASHVGIYLGGNKFIHSPSAGKSVEIVSLKNSYWKDAYFSAGRFLK